MSEHNQKTLADLSAAYNPAEIEGGRYQTWEEAGFFKPTFDKLESFSIAIPPPNVTGSLHMGHGFNNAIMDALKGYERSAFDRSIDVRVTRLRRKIETHPAEPCYLITVWGEGYLFAPEGRPTRAPESGEASA